MGKLVSIKEGGGFEELPSLKLTAFSPLKIGKPTRKEENLPTIHFQVRSVSFREGSFTRFLESRRFGACHYKQAILLGISICYGIFFGTAQCFATKKLPQKKCVLPSLET